MLESPAGGAITVEEQISAPRSLMRQDSKSRWENGWMFPRRWMLPALNSDFSNNTDIFKSKDTEVIRVKEDDSKLEVSLDTSQYRPDELGVSVSDGGSGWRASTRRRRRTAARWCPECSPGSTRCPPAPSRRRSPPTSPLMVSWSSPRPRRPSPSSNQ